MEKSNRLDDIPLFQGLSEKLLETISKRALVKTYRAGEAVVNEEDERRRPAPGRRQEDHRV